MSFTVSSNAYPNGTSTITDQAVNTFYKYEAFSFTFTGGSAVIASGTLSSFCSRDSSGNLVFSSTKGFQTTSPFETLSATLGSTKTYRIVINGGRFQLTPPITSLVLYQNETAPSTTFLSPIQLSIAYPTPALPLGLTITNPSFDGYTWLLSGTPTIVAASSNYLILGSNTTGGIVTTTLPILVSNQRIVITPPTVTPLTLGTPFASSLFGVTVPTTATGSVTFTATNLPPGLGLDLVNGLPVPSKTVSAPYPVNVVGTPTYPGTITSFTTSIQASILAPTLLTTTATISFSYATSIYFTNSTISNQFYLGVSNSAQFTAVSFPSGDAPTYSSTSPLPPGLTLSSTGVLSGTATTVWSNSFAITASNATSSGTASLTLTVIPVTVSVTSNVPSTSFIVGKAISPITFTFASDAYRALSSNITVSSSLPPGLLATRSDTTVIVSGIPTTDGSGILSVTVTTTDGATATGSTPYVTAPDVFAFSASSNVFSWTQNVPITPIQFSVTTQSGTPVTYFTNSSSFPIGLYMTPGGTLQGTPSNSSSLTALNGIIATNNYSTLSPPSSQYQYSTLRDTIHLVSSPISNILIPNTAVNIPFTIQSISGYTPPSTLTVSFSNYTYGLTATTTNVGGTLGACVYPDIILPAYTTLTAYIGPYSIPTIIGLSNSTPQLINRFTLRWSGSSYNIYRDNGTLSFVNSSILIKINTIVSINGRGTVTITTATAHGLRIGSVVTMYGMLGTASQFNTVFGVTDVTSPTIFKIQSSMQVGRDDENQSSINAYMIASKSSIPHSFESRGSTMVIADGTPNILFSTNGTSFSNTSIQDTSIYNVTYMSSISRWIAFTYNNTDGQSIYFSSNLSTWTSNKTYGTTPGANLNPNSQYVMRAFSSNLLIGGNQLVYSQLPTVPIENNNQLCIGTNCTLTNVLSIAVSPVLAIASGNGPSTIQYSSNGIAWSNATGAFTTVTCNVVYGPGSWLASGVDDVPGVKYSLDGSNWAAVPLSLTTIGPIQFDGTSWCIFAKTGTNIVNGVDKSFVLYRHDALGSTLSNLSTWTSNPVTFSDSAGTDTPDLYTFPIPQYGPTPTVNPVLYMGTTPNGPAFTAPAVTNYLIYQYISITPITFAAGSDAAYFLASTLPPGMTWNVATATISGLSVNLGTFPVTIYAQNSVGASSLTITFVVSRAVINHNHPNAASYTSFLREKVTADAATAAINNHSTPFEVGTFALERPPVVQTASELCCEQKSII